MSMYQWCFALFILLTVLSCQSKPQVKKDLDPYLVSIAGENYEDLIIEKSKFAVEDTVQILQIAIDSFAFDLRKGQREISHTFEFLNEGVDTSIIINYFSYCECFLPMGEIIIVNPSESASLNVTFDPRAWEQGESKNLYVRTSHFPHLYTLKIKRKS